ncbi:MAG: hypothetical protein ABEJ03_00305 [Candidatus Nanohaloarchaea archaeon]
MSEVISGSDVRVEFPEEWEGEVSEEEIARIREIAEDSIAQDEDYGFDKFIIENEGGKVGAFYGGRNEKGYPMAGIDVFRTDRVVPIFAHEQGHDRFRHRCAGIRDKEDSLTSITLNELVADLNAWDTLEEDEIDRQEGKDYLRRRSPFHRRNREGFETLSEVLDVEIKQEKLSILDELYEQVENQDYNSAHEEMEKIRDLSTDFRQVNTHDDSSRGMFVEGFSQVARHTRIEIAMESLTSSLAGEESGSDEVASLIYRGQDRIGENCYSEVVEEVLSEKGFEELVSGGRYGQYGQKGTRDLREVIEEHQEEIAKEVLRRKKEELKEETENFLEFLEEVDRIDETYRRIRDERYGYDGDGVDFPHQVAGITAQVIHGQGYGAREVTEKPEQYAEICTEAIKDTIDLGLAMADEGYEVWNSDNAAEYEEELRSRIEEKVLNLERNGSSQPG